MLDMVFTRFLLFSKLPFNFAGALGKFVKECMNYNAIEQYNPTRYKVQKAANCIAGTLKKDVIKACRENHFFTIAVDSSSDIQQEESKKLFNEEENLAIEMRNMVFIDESEVYYDKSTFPQLSPKKTKATEPIHGKDSKKTKLNQKQDV